MSSTDLVHWQEHSGAMAPLPERYREYWAPEVSFWNGRFYMYYSCGDGVVMHLRVAVSDVPDGPFQDSGHRLSSEDFAIDPHVFEDDDGTRYLFYATDFLAHTHVGTGTAVDRLIDPFTLAGHARPVARARYDWQVYDPHRLEKGGVRWHTVEGPFVLKFKGRYYQMYSGGNWQNTSYGVSYAVTPRIDTLDEWEQLEHTDARPLVLRTLPGEVIGPGHNSVVRGPDNFQLFCMYHRWAHDGSGRLLALDRLEWVGDRISVLGPSTTMQPAPTPPTASGFRGWKVSSGNWLMGARSARHAGGSDGSARLPLPSASFVLETSLRIENSALPCAAGLSLRDLNGRSVAIVFGAAGPAVLVYTNADQVHQPLTVPADFGVSDLHELRLEIDGRIACLRVDGRIFWRGTIRLPASEVEIFAAAGADVLFSGFSVTAGWHHVFMDPGVDLGALGWTETVSPGAWDIRDGRLVCTTGRKSLLLKETGYESYEAVLNVKCHPGEGPLLGVMPALSESGEGPLFTFSAAASGPVLDVRELPGGEPLVSAETAPLVQSFQLPPETNLMRFQQLRFRKRARRITCMLEFHELGEVGAPPQPTRVGLLAYGTAAACDSVRVTAFPADQATRGERG